MRYRLLFIASALAACLAASAQEPVDVPITSLPETREEIPVDYDRTTIDANGLQNDYILPGQPGGDPMAMSRDSLHLPLLTYNGSMPPIGMYPLYWGGWYAWDLHKGLNVNLGASVFAQFGKNAHHGAGFTQNLSAMYAMPVTDKLSIAVGGYINNVYWAHDAYRDAGASAVLAYKFDEHWEAYLYGQKSLVNNRFIPYPLYDLGELRDRIGAAVKYNFSPNFSVQVSVERGER